jgi:hypothetical protein
MAEVSGSALLLVALLLFPLIFITARKNVLALPETREDDANDAPEVDPDANSSDHERDAGGELEAEEDSQPKSIMQPEKTNLAPPRDDPFTLEELQEFDGTNPEKPIYVSIKGDVVGFFHVRT